MLVLELLFECPQCRAWHDQPASALLGVRILCLDCDLDAQMREALEASLVTTADPVTRAA
ncbi:MAG: hypothetical protein NVS2B8_12540 [Vulcanimicrobiaceae bacterium]